MQHTHHAAVESFWASAVLILAALIYVRGWIRIRRLERDRVGGGRAASFFLGLFLILIAVASPVAALDHQLLTVHMVQHLLLMTLAPPFIWLGAPITPLAQGSSPRFIEAFLAPIPHWALMKRLEKSLANPTVCWLAAATTLIGWHIPFFFALGMRSELWHGIEQTSFLISGVLFWWPVIRLGPSASDGSEWSILLYLFLATLPCDILSGFLVFCERVVYPIYFSAPHRLAFSALEDQQCAGALMWTCVTIVYLVAGTIIAARLLSPQNSHPYSFPISDAQLSAGSHTTPQRMEVL